MIQNYIIKKENNEDVLYLYLDYNYEFAIFKQNKEKSFFNQLKDFLKNKAVNFKGKKIVLVVSGIVIGTIFLNNINFKNYEFNNDSNFNDISYVSQVILNDFNNENEVANTLEIDLNNDSIEVKEQNLLTTNNENEKAESINHSHTTSNTHSNRNDSPTIYQSSQSPNKAQNTATKQPSMQEQINNNENKTMVTVYRTNGDILSIELEEYIIGVVAGEMPASFNSEALKAQAVIARTYTLKSMSQNKKLTDSVSTQVYIDTSQMKAKWGNDYLKYYNKIKSAVESTSGLYITYNGSYIDAVYFSTSNGYTEDSKYVWGNDIPYLKSVESSWDIGTSSYSKTVSKSFSEINSILGMNINETVQIENIQRNNSNRISSITINGQIYTGVQIRSLFGLASADFDIEVTSTGLTFTTRGYGHGVGLSQYGANGMALEGYTYDQIIKHYYQGVQIK